MSTEHDLSRDRTQEHVDKKVYMFPASYNALRQELMEHWPNLWNSPIQYAMWADAPRFIEAMDHALDMVTQFDSGNVDGICKKYLDGLRGLRGLEPLHPASEYRNNNEMEAEVRAARDEQEIAPWRR